MEVVGKAKSENASQNACAMRSGTQDPEGSKSVENGVVVGVDTDMRQSSQHALAQAMKNGVKLRVLLEADPMWGRYRGRIGLGSETRHDETFQMIDGSVNKNGDHAYWWGLGAVSDRKKHGKKGCA